MFIRMKAFARALVVAFGPLSLASLLSLAVFSFAELHAQGVAMGNGETLGAQLRRLARQARGNNPVEKPRLLGGQAWSVLTSATWPTTGTVSAGQLYYSSTAAGVYRVIIGGTIVNGTQPTAAAYNFSGTYFQDNGNTGVVYQYANYYVGQNFSNAGMVYQIASCASTCTPATSGTGPAPSSLTDGQITWTLVGQQTAPVVSVQQTYNSALSNWYQPGAFAGAMKGVILTDNSAAGVGNVGPFKWSGGYPVVIGSASSNGPTGVAAVGPTYYASGNCGSGLVSIGAASTGIPSSVNFAITAASWSGGFATFTLSASTSTPVGVPVTIAGMTPAGYNGSFITAAGTTGSTIVVAMASNPGAQTSTTVMASSAWSTAASGALAITTSTPTGVTGIGQWIYISGLTNGGSGGASLVTGWFYVNAFTSNESFSVAMPGTGATIGSVSGTGSVSLGYVPQLSPSCYAQHVSFVSVANKIAVAFANTTQFSVRVDGQDVDNYYLNAPFNSQISNPAQWVGATNVPSFLIDFTNAGGRAAHTIELTWSVGAALSVVALAPGDSLSYPNINAGDDFPVVILGTSLSSGSICYNLANCWYNFFAQFVGLPDDITFGEGGTGVVDPSGNPGTIDYQSHAFFDIQQYVTFKNGVAPRVVLVDCCTNDSGLTTFNVTVNVVNGSPVVTPVGNMRIPYWIDKMTFTIGGTSYAAAGHSSYNQMSLTTPYAGPSGQATLAYTILPSALTYALINQDSTCNLAATPPNGCGLLPNLRHVAPNALIVGVGSPAANSNYISGTATVSGQTLTGSSIKENYSGANSSGFSTIPGAMSVIEVGGAVCPIKSVTSATVLTIATGCTLASGTFHAPMNPLVNPLTNPTGSFASTAVTDATTSAEITGYAAWQSWAAVDPAGPKLSGFIPAQLRMPPLNPPVMGSAYQGNTWGPCSLATVSTASAAASSLAGNAAYDSTGSIHENDCGHKDAAFSYLPGYMTIINAMP